MPRPARTSLLAVAGLVGALLGASPVHAAPGDAVPVFEAGPSGSPVTLRPLSQTAAGLVFQDPEDTLEIKVYVRPTGGDAELLETPFTNPLVNGDLILQHNGYAEQEGFGGDVLWRTITDPTVHEHEVPRAYTYKMDTDRGYLAQRGDGPYELLSVDLRGGSTVTVLGTASRPFTYLTPGPSGVLARFVDGWTFKEFRYYAYATPGTGRLIPATGGYCSTITSTDAYCDSGAGGLVRRPLSGAAATTWASNAYVRDVVPTAAGVAFLRSDSAGGYDLMSWPTTSSVPVERLDATFGLDGELAPTASGTSVVVSRGGSLDRAGLWNIPLPSGASSRLAAAPPQDRAATRVALGPGSVLWYDNQHPGGSLWTRDRNAEGALSGSERLVSTDADDARLTTGAGRHAFLGASSSLAYDLHLVDGSSATQLAGRNRVATLSGDRLLYGIANEGYDDETLWRVRDLRSGRTTRLPAALDYDLWGERLVRLTSNGEVSVIDLRTGSDPVVLRAGTPTQWLDGQVHIAGDLVAWDLDGLGESGMDGEHMTRHVATTTPPTSLSIENGQGPEIEDLSTGYAVTSAAAHPLDGGDPVVLSTAHRAPVAADGNIVAIIDSETTGGIPHLVELPAYPDAPRLLGSPARTTTAGPGRDLGLRVVTSRVLTACTVEIRDAEDAVVRTFDCVDPHAAATVTWDVTDADGEPVAPGTYSWHLSGATGAEDLVDYDGGTEALSGTVTVSDDPPPAIETRTPAVDGHSAAPAGNVTVRFDEPVAGVGGTNVQLREFETDTPVPATVTYNATTRTATLDPAATLSSDTVYTVNLTGGADAIRDLAGNPLESTGWTFTTGPAPVPTKLTPASNSTNASLSGDVTAMLSEYVTGVDTGTFTLATAGGTPVPGTIETDPDGNEFTEDHSFDPTASLLPDTRYTATLTGGVGAIRDFAGNPLTTRSWSFTTGPAPTVTGKSPAANATNVSRTANVVAAFSEPVAGVSGTTVKLRTSSGTTVSAVVSYSTTSRKVTLNPSATLAAKTKYTVTLTGGASSIRDAAGNPLTTTSWSFTTGA